MKPLEKQSKNHKLELDDVFFFFSGVLWSIKVSVSLRPRLLHIMKLLFCLLHGVVVRREEEEQQAKKKSKHLFDMIRRDR